MVAPPVGLRRKRSNPARTRSLFSGITTAPLVLIAATATAAAVVLLPHLEAYASVSVIHRPNESLLHLAALSSLSVSAINSSGGAFSSGRTGSAGASNHHQRPFTGSTLLGNESNPEASGVHSSNNKTNNSNNNGDGNEIRNGAVTSPAPSVSDTATASLSAVSSFFSNNPIAAFDGSKMKKTVSEWKQAIDSSPRARACVLMATAMSLHFGGYEFARSAALALFTSSETGFTHPSAYPFAIGLITPLTLTLLYWYGTVLKSSGPRRALRTTTSFVLAMLLAGDGMISVLTSDAFVWTPSGVAWLTRPVVALLFVFQNSYAHLIYTQQWSFLGSVMTPTEGTRWFTFIAGLSSVVCTLTASSVKTIANRSGGLVLLIFMTCATLCLSMVCADRAYELSSEHGFDPSRELQEKQSKKDSEKKGLDAATDGGEESLLAKTGRMFRTSPTLAGLFGEVITFQSLSTVLNVCFVRQLKLSIPVDGDRAAFTGQFYAGVNGVSGLMQFFVLPLLRKYLEPQWVYRFLPLLLMPLFTYAAVVPASAGSGLGIATIAFFALKSTDYSIRNIANELVYQPLDFDARYLGKEVIGVFANRFGKSGTSMILSGLSGFGLLTKGTRSMSQLAVVVGGLWSACSITLSNYVVTNRQAEEQVQQRSNRKQQSGDAIATEGNPVSSTASSSSSSSSSSHAEVVQPTSTAASHAEEATPILENNHIADGEQETTTELSKEAVSVPTTVSHTDEMNPVIDENRTSGAEQINATSKIKEE